jgi:hypothetical protein
MVCAHILYIHLCPITTFPAFDRNPLSLYRILLFSETVYTSIMSTNPIVRAAQRAARAVSRIANHPIPGLGGRAKTAANIVGGALLHGMRNRGGLTTRPSTTVTVRTPVPRGVPKRRSFPQSSQGVATRRQRSAGGNKRKHYVVHVPYREECLGNVVSSSTASAFSLQSYALNIGNSTSFPQGSIMAPLFQRHRFRKLVYRIETTSGMAIGSTSTALGSTLLNCDYNVVDAVFPDQIHMEDYGKNGVKKMCREAVIYKNNVFHVDCSRSLTLEPDDWMFVQPGTTASTVTAIANTSVHEYAHGLMQIASVGLQGTSQVIGRLFVGYESDFAICITPPPGVSALAAHITETQVTTASATYPLGNVKGVFAAGSNLTSVATSTTFTLPLTGLYLVTGNWVGSGVAAVPIMTAGANITRATNYFSDDSVAFLSSYNSAGTAASYITAYSVNTAGTGTANTVTISGLTSLVTATADIFITQLSPNILTSPALPPISNNHMALRLAALEKRFSQVELKCDDDYETPLVCPCCDTVKIELPFNGFCSRKCLVHSDSLDTKDNLIHLSEDEAFVRVTPQSATSVFPGIPLSEKDDYITRLAPLWNNVLPIPSTLPNCVDLVCRGRRESPRPTVRLSSLTPGL